MFAPSFLEQVPASKLTAIFADYFSRMGRCTQAKQTTPLSAYAGRFDFTFEKGYTVPATLAIDADEPRLLNGLLLGVPTRNSATLDETVNELKTLPGETSLLVTSLGKDGTRPIVAYNADREMAIGSAFKLYILSELVREVGARERKWTDVVPLNGKIASLPSGVLQSWPAGSPVTLHTLATMMISISDNTAADELLMTLGRERVEAVLAGTGHTKPELNAPFLSTLEMFKLKGEPTGQAATTYLALDARGRRAFLADTIAKVKSEDAKPFQDGKPAYVDKIEWFASAADMCRVMNWLRQQTEGDKTARQILAINPGSGLSIPRDKWQYVGFKGGSEPGVLNMTYLLQSTKGEWYALSVGWNNQQAPLQNEKLFALLQQILKII
jgi:Beta-lactamase enzyme family